MRTPKRSLVMVLMVAMSAILALSLVRGPDAAAVMLPPSDILVVEQGGLIHVDSHTGQHRVIATAGLCCVNGAQFHLAIDADRQFVAITNPLLGQVVAAVVRVHSVDGTQTLVSQGEFLRGPSRMAIDPSGDIFVSDCTLDGFSIVIRIDPLTGAQTVVTEYVGGWALTAVSLPAKKKR